MGTRPGKERIELGTRNMHGLWKICIWFLDGISIVKNEIGSLDFGGFMGVGGCVGMFASLQKYRYHVQEYEYVPVGGLHLM